MSRGPDTHAEPLAWFGDPAELVAAADTEPGRLLSHLTRLRPAWMRDAACRGMPVSTFFPRRGESSSPAKQICSTCEVIDQCRTWGLDQPEPAGILGGIGGRQRRAARRADQPSAPTERPIK